MRILLCIYFWFFIYFFILITLHDRTSCRALIFNRAEIKSIKAVCLPCVAQGAKKERGAARGVGAGGRQKETGIAMHCFLDSCPKWLLMGAVLGLYRDLYLFLKAGHVAFCWWFIETLITTDGEFNVSSLSLRCLLLILTGFPRAKCGTHDQLGEMNKVPFSLSGRRNIPCFGCSVCILTASKRSWKKQNVSSALHVENCETIWFSLGVRVLYSF